VIDSKRVQAKVARNPTEFVTVLKRILENGSIRNNEAVALQSI
jgi:hypothetical protein